MASNPEKPGDDSGLSKRETRLGEVLREFLEAIDSGATPDPDETLARYPDLAPDLESFFADQEFVSRLISSGEERSKDGRKGRVLSPPVRFSEYELIEELDPGGMGVVYKARQERLNRIVALKMIRSGRLATIVDHHRFQLEARAVASLDHSNIVPLYDVGEHEGRHYFTMKFLEGGSLAARIPKLLDVPLASARLMQTVAHAVQYAHERGILHRDLKPANILLDLDGVPYVTDFGLAKRLEDTAVLTHTGTLVGTPAYMAPEQVSGKRGAVTTAADVYSLGAILYECLTGQMPFRGDSIPELLKKVVNEEPVRPSQIHRGIPADLETICLTCLEKDPRKRYVSAGELAEDLGNFCDNKPIRARPSSSWKRIGKWCRRHPAAAALVAVSSMALVSLVVVSFWYNAQLKEAAEEATRRELMTRRLLYDARMILAYDTFKDANRARTRELLLDQVPEEGELDLRSFDWGYLWRGCHRARWTFRHTDDVYSLAFSPVSPILATAGRDQQVILWDTATGERRRTLKDPGGEIYALTFSADGSLLAAGGMKRPISVWNPETRTKEFVLEGHTDVVSSLAFTRNDRFLISGSGDRTIRIWDLERRSEHAVLEGHGVNVHSVAISPDGTTLASGGGGFFLKVWDLDTGDLIHSFREHSASVLAVAFSRHSDLLATGSWDKSVRIWETDSWKVRSTFVGHTAPVHGVAFSPTGPWLATAGYDHTVRILDTADGREIVALKDHDGIVRSVAFSQDGTLLASCGHDGTAKIWNLTDLDELTIENSHDDSVTMLGFPAKPGTLITGGRDLTLCLWSLAQSDGAGRIELLSDWKVDVEGVSTCALSPDATTLAAAGQDLLLRLWRVEKGPDGLAGREEAVLAGHNAPLRDLEFSVDSKTLVSAAEDGTVRLWERRASPEGMQWQTRECFEVGVNDVWDAALSPDGRTVAMARKARKAESLVLLWDVNERRIRATLGGHQDWVIALAFSDDSRLLATGGLDWKAKLWELPEDGGPPRLRATLEGHKNAVASLAFSPDGKILASGSDDRTVRFWDLITGRERGKLEGGHAGAVDDLLFSPDTRLLISAGGVSNEKRGEVRVWRGSSAEELPARP